MFRTATKWSRLPDENRQLDEQRVAGRVTSVREHVVPELHGRADTAVVGALHRRAAAYVVPDAGHDVLGRDIRLVEHAEPQPVRERPLELRVELARDRHRGHAHEPGRHVRVYGQRHPVAAGRHVEWRASGLSVHERQPPERVHAPIVDERSRGWPPTARATTAVRRGEHGAVVRADLPKSSGVPPGR